jgi:hypothetical protein
MLVMEDNGISSLVRDVGDLHHPHLFRTIFGRARSAALLKRPDASGNASGVVTIGWLRLWSDRPSASRYLMVGHEALGTASDAKLQWP